MSSSSDLRVGFLGAGMMAEALARGFDAAGVATLRNVTAFDVAAPRREAFTAAGATVVASNKEARVLHSQRHATLPAACRGGGVQQTLHNDTVPDSLSTHSTHRWSPAPTSCSCASSPGA